jgi:16S rRNA (uracil1498-N3)-methyltransferase
VGAGAVAREARRPDTPFWVDPAEVRGNRLHLSPEESHHLLKVHRAAPETAFEAIDGEGTLYRCVVEAVNRRAVIGRIEDRVRDAGELKGSIHLLVGTPDPGAAEAVVTRAVPLGATAIEFVRTERSEPCQATGPRLARVSRVARAALKQTRRTRLPAISFAPSLQSALAGLPGPPQRFLADPGGAPWSESPSSGVSECVVLAVGPPGGFTREEVEHLRRERFCLISLGPNRLTTEDAVGALLTLCRQVFLGQSRAGH